MRSKRTSRANSLGGRRPDRETARSGACGCSRARAQRAELNGRRHDSIRASAQSTRARVDGDRAGAARATPRRDRTRRPVAVMPSSRSANERYPAGSRSRSATIWPASSDIGNPNSRRAPVGVRSTWTPSWWPSCSTVANRRRAPPRTPRHGACRSARRERHAQRGTEVDDHHDPGLRKLAGLLRAGGSLVEAVTLRTYRRSGALGARLVGASGRITIPSLSAHGGRPDRHAQAHAILERESERLVERDHRCIARPDLQIDLDTA